MASRPKRKNLPQRLLRFDQEIDESVCLRAQVADAISAW